MNMSAITNRPNQLSTSAESAGDVIGPHCPPLLTTLLSIRNQQSRRR
ncbi:uncharacterized protein METZ01_LOCUS479424, partial [marine metagenome]